MPNRDFVSSETFLKNYNLYKYDSFIFGSSRTMAYKTKSWRQYLPKNISPFVFDGLNESIYGIHKKIMYLKKNNIKIKNCLIIVCPGTTFSRETDHLGHLGIKHPTISETSWLNFYKVALNDYYSLNFLKAYFQFLITKKYNSSMSEYIINEKIISDNITNDGWLMGKENEILNNPAKYYGLRKQIFYTRDGILKFTPQKITTKQLTMLKEIRITFNKYHTNYKLVISPMYDQIKFNVNDLNTIKNIFGKDKVYDYSGINKFTAKKEYYYESQHYRPILGDSLMKIIYH